MRQCLLGLSLMLAVHSYAEDLKLDIAGDVIKKDSLQLEVDRVLSQELKLEEVKSKENLKESEIPVLVQKAEVKTAETSPYSRLILSFLVIAIAGTSLAMVSRWWKKRTEKSEDNNKIRMVTQHFLGPRKSLAIVRVAGESILIGVTDQNINMIKSLSLIEDESSTSLDSGVRFDEVLDSKTREESATPISPEAQRDETEDFAFANIRDRISSKIKDMRPL